MDGASYQYTEFVVERYQMILQNIATIKEHLERSMIAADRHTMSPILSALSQLHTSLPNLILEWQRHQDEMEANILRYQAPLYHSGNPGRPRFVVLQEQLEYLRSLHFSWINISGMLGISRMTLYRRRVEYDMVTETLQSISDTDYSRIKARVSRHWMLHGGRKITQPWFSCVQRTHSNGHQEK